MAICTICLDVMDSETCTLPGCNHTFHCVCLLNSVQYDARCPVCRRHPVGVVIREDTTNTADEMPAETPNEMRVLWRRYTARRRRFLIRHPIVKANLDALHRIRRKMRTEVESAQRLYDARCRSIWREDKEILEHRAHLGRMRRRERRLEVLLEAELDVLGPEQFFTAPT